MHRAQQQQVWVTHHPEKPGGKKKSQNYYNVRRMAVRRIERNNPAKIRKNQKQVWAHIVAPG